MLSYFTGGSKQETRTYSGFYGDLSPSQEECLATIKQWAKAENLDTRSQFDDYDWLRFCRARAFVTADVQTMCAKYFEWRNAENVDTILVNFEYAELEAVKKCFVHGYHGVDKQGRPVILERMGMIDIPNLLAATTPERLCRYMTYFREVQMKIRMPYLSRIAGKKIDTFTCVQDLSGISMSLMNK